MAFDKLQKLSELSDERRDLQKRIEGIDADICRIIGDGFDIEGLVRVKPLKRGKKASTPTSAASSATAGEAPEKLSGAETGRRVLALIDERFDQNWTAPDIGTALNISARDAASALYWLWHNNKIQRPQRGMYRSLKKAAA
jgi:hypothetical protein